MTKKKTDITTKATATTVKTKKYPWVNPVGGLGDVLMFSGVMKQVFDEDPNKKFNLVRRTKYWEMLKGHPAIEKIGFPGKDDQIQDTTYWSMEKLGPGEQRAYQILARAFGLKTPVEEKLFIPGTIEDDKFLLDFVPWKKKNILIAPASDSPRKMMNPMAWHILTEKLLAEDYFVLQAGKLNDLYIKGTYSLLGATSPREAIALVKNCDLVITTDNYIMHAAKLVNTPAIVLWGPTSHLIYGYKEHKHFQADTDFCELKNKCIGPHCPENYATMCPLQENQCLNKINIDDIFNAVLSV